MALISFLQRQKWKIALILAIVFLFYWYEIRPIFVYRQCAVEASLDARKLLVSKAEIAKGTKNGETYKTMATKGMYLRSDYDSFLKKCLYYHGMSVPAAKPAAPKAAESSASSKS